MADCPVCGSRLFTQRMFPNLFSRRFGCPACKWSMSVKEVHRRGGLESIKRNLIKKHTGSSNRRKKRKHKRRPRNRRPYSQKPRGRRR